MKSVIRSGVAALSGVTLDMGPGVLGLLGPNGAGKSTLLRIVATVMGATSGRVFWNGADVAKQPRRLRAALGYLPQDAGVYPNLTAREFLTYVAALKGLTGRPASERIELLLEELNLNPSDRRPLAAYSGGMRQRVGIAQALLNDPSLVIVDEPTVGLDPEERARFRDLLAGIAGDRIVLLSTHIVSDVESLAERVVMMRQGRVIADGAPDALASALAGRTWEGIVGEADLPRFREAHLVTSAVRRRNGVHVRMCADGAPAGFSPALPTLEEAYLVHVRAGQAA